MKDANTVDSLVWFEKELRRLQESPNVNLFIHITSKGPMSTLSPTRLGSTPAPGANTVPSPTEPATEADVEKGSMFQPPATEAMSSLDTRAGRPDITHHVSSRAERCQPGKRVCVAVCGLDMMVDTTRKAVSGARSSGGVSITLHSEVSDVLSLVPSYTP